MLQLNIISEGVYAFEIPTGFTSPGSSSQSLNATDPRTGALLIEPESDSRIVGVTHTAALEEAHLPEARSRRWLNWMTLRMLISAGPIQYAVKHMADALGELITADVKMVQINRSGDFFHPAYFLAWMVVAAANPKVKFFSFTEAVPTWVRHEATVPENVFLRAQLGGAFDALAKEKGYPVVLYVRSRRLGSMLGEQLANDYSNVSNRNRKVLVHSLDAPRDGEEEAPAHKAQPATVVVIPARGTFGGSGHPEIKSFKALSA